MGHVVKAIDNSKLYTIIWDLQTIEQGRLSFSLVHFTAHIIEALKELFIRGKLQIAVLILPFSFKFVEFFTEEFDYSDNANEQFVDDGVDQCFQNSFSLNLLVLNLIVPSDICVHLASLEHVVKLGIARESDVISEAEVGNDMLAGLHPVNSFFYFFLLGNLAHSCLSCDVIHKRCEHHVYKVCHSAQKLRIGLRMGYNDE